MLSRETSLCMFESNVILDSGKTMKKYCGTIVTFESNVILDSGKTLCPRSQSSNSFESNVILDSGKTFVNLNIVLLCLRVM